MLWANHCMSNEFIPQTKLVRGGFFHYTLICKAIGHFGKIGIQKNGYVCSLMVRP